VSWKVGVFDHTGVVTGCFKCHDGVSATGKSGAHLTTSNNCEACHNTIAWAPAHFDHTASPITNCVDCHDGRRATGRSFAHFKTTNDCASCHVIAAWKPAKFDHNLALDLPNCFSCHDGNHPLALGKKLGHIPSSNICTDCHSNTQNYTSWTNAKFNHNGIVGGCFACHNSVTATGKNKTHLATTDSCESCHAPGVNWATSKFDHTQTAGGTCASCHDGAQKTSLTGQIIIGKLQGPTGKHMPTTDVCDTCHTTTHFVPATTFDHGQMTVTTCFTCHNGTSATSVKTITFKGANHVASGTDCESCHTSFTVWSAAFNHSGIGSARCDSCHNNNPVLGKPPTHLAVNAGPDCVACHTGTTSWTAIKFDHSIVSPVCLTCHNGTTKITTGVLTHLPTKHIPISTGCETCHTSFTTWVTTFNHATTSAACFTCHNGTIATGKLSLSGHHVPTSTTCENCHVTTGWLRPAEKMNHGDATVAATPCLTCHNNTDATGKSSKHILSSSSCTACHNNTNSWTPAAMDHNDPTVAGATCFSCHDGAHADINPINGKLSISGKHVNSSNLCADCHTTTAWKPVAKFDHTQAIGTCFSCHDGTSATGKLTVTGTHVVSSNDCALCHTVAAWKPATFDHTDPIVAAATCISCHNGTVPNAKSKIDAVGFPNAPDHSPASFDNCSNCHTTTAFTPAHFDHGTVSGLPCANCHDVGKPNAVVRPVNHPPLAGQDCAACHTTATWVTNAKPDHTNFVNNCITCHTGTPNAKGKSDAPNHFATTNNCDACHNTTAFKPAVFVHTEAVNSANCFACHDGAPTHLPAFGKSAFPAHLLTSNTCSNCHAGFATWVTTKFDHADTVVAAATCITCHDGAHSPAIPKSVSHFKTSNDCALCHNTTLFKPITKFDHTDAVVAAAACFSCHDGAHPPALSKANAPAPGHLPTSNLCGDCHNTTAFKPASFDHSGIAGTACFTCHNNVRATGKTTTHFATTNTCDDCHSTVTWKPMVAFPHTSTTGTCYSCHNGSHLPAVTKGIKHITSTTVCDACHKSTVNWTVTALQVDHTQVTGSCFSCHNTTIASGKGPTHFSTSNNCDACHKTGVPWTPVSVFDHTAAVGTCFSCHSGSHLPAIGKTATHMTTTNACDSCHTTIAWKPAPFDHSQALGTCANCHNGAHPPAVTKGTGHFITSQPCEVCHTTANWTTLLPYSHMSPAYVNHGANTPTCITCHKQNNEKITFLQPGLAPDCAACHADKFVPDSHPKFGNAKYTFTELRDCTGACHTYTDQTLTTIKSRRNGPQHSARRNQWN
jgi:hypothetical protein